MVKSKQINQNQSTKVQKPLCFVVMPMLRVAAAETATYNKMGKAELDTIFNLFKATLGKHGYAVRRSSGKGDILQKIVLDLDRAELVCADLTGLNPNVMYELGIRHGFTKRTILLTQDINELPFDLRNYHCIEYGWVTEEQKEQLRRDIRGTLKEMDADPDTKYGPVHSHLGTKKLAWEEEEKASTLRRLSGLVAELHLLDDSCDRTTKLIRESYPDAIENDGGGWAIDPSKLDMDSDNAVWATARSRWALSYPSIDLFLSTRYISDKFNQFRDIDYFTSVLGQIRFGISSATSTLKDYFRMHILVSNAAIDAGMILSAVADDQFGEDLRLSVKHIETTGDVSGPSPLIRELMSASER